MPKEEKLEVIKKGKQFSIGIPKETSLNERRACITPDAVQVLVESGHEIIIESGAGLGSFFYRSSVLRIGSEDYQRSERSLFAGSDPQGKSAY